jgi:DNA-binding NarL/FixJ family response regulator
MGATRVTISDFIRDGSPKLEHVAVLHWLRQKVPKADFPVIIHTADHSARVDLWAKARGVCAVFRKGDDPKELLRAIRQVLANPASKQAA